MGMISIKKGKRGREIRISISENTKMMTFSAGFMRYHNPSKEKFSCLRLGYDPEIKAIGIEFLEKMKDSEECFKIAYPNKSTSGVVSVRSLISNFDLDIDEISGDYKTDAIEGPVSIPGFATQGYLLKIGMRSEDKSKKGLTRKQ